MVPSPTLRLLATARWLSPKAHFWRRISRICRMDSRSAATAPLSAAGADGLLDHPVSPAQAPAPFVQGQSRLFTITDLRVHHPDLGVHHERSGCSRGTDLRVHVRPIRALPHIRTEPAGAGIPGVGPASML